jgi:hypothetical protein
MLQRKEPEDREFGIYCKSFHADFEHLSLLLESFAAHNPDRLTLTISLPKADIHPFRSRFGSRLPYVEVVADEDYCDRDYSDLPGWHAQQVSKLNSWRIMNVSRYVIVDSDCYAIRDILSTEFRPQTRDFLAYGSLVRTVLKSDNVDLIDFIRGKTAADKPIPRPQTTEDNLASYLKYRTGNLDNPGPLERSAIPMKVFGAKQWIYYQPGQIFCREVVVALMDYLRDHGLKASDLIRISPWEYNWYGEFIASRFFERTEFRISPFVHFQEESDIVFAQSLGITEAELSKHFVFIQMAARHCDRKRLDLEPQFAPSTL